MERVVVVDGITVMKGYQRNSAGLHVYAYAPQKGWVLVTVFEPAAFAG
jgi:hypothetical protein